MLRARSPKFKSQPLYPTRAFLGKTCRLPGLRSFTSKNRNHSASPRDGEMVRAFVNCREPSLIWLLAFCCWCAVVVQATSGGWSMHVYLVENVRCSPTGSPGCNCMIKSGKCCLISITFIFFGDMRGVPASQSFPFSPWEISQAAMPALISILEIANEQNDCDEWGLWRNTMLGLNVSDWRRETWSLYWGRWVVN